MKHGLKKHPLYVIWKGIRARCYRISASNYKYYGGRGIVMCEEWKNNFLPFYHWCMDNGWQKGLKIDREINDEGYSPTNCRIVTHQTNMRNTRVTKMIVRNGLNLSLIEWSEMYNINYRTVKTRINQLGWDIEKALTTPSKH